MAVKGPSTTTAAELTALQKFRDAKTDFAPQLVAFHQQPQDDRGPLPGGFITFTIMTKLPGFALFGKYWNLDSSERDQIVPKAVQALRALNEIGIEPTDRGMRNVIWEYVPPEASRSLLYTNPLTPRQSCQQTLWHH